MGLIEKLETLINRILFFLGGLFARFVLKLTPRKIQTFCSLLASSYARGLAWIKALPMRIIKATPGAIAQVMSFMKGFDFKGKLAETKKIALEQYALSQKGTKISDFKKFLITPFLIFGQWLKGLTTNQMLLLMSFTAASFLASINMIFSGNRILTKHMQENRAPASVEAEVSFERPEYYKKQIRHMEINSLRLPVFFANVNELRTIDVDFSITLSNRLARMKLEKLEFQLRDHLILEVEPMVASFPLVEEGKDILKEKLHMEINAFLAQREIDGEVKEVKLIYILAN